MLQAKNVYKNYMVNKMEIPILKGVSLSIKKGEFVSILGVSGSGKSTLLNVISGFDKITKGEILINGKDISKLNDEQISDFRNKNIGFVFQSFQLEPYYTAVENTALPLLIGGIPKKERIERSKAALKLVGLEHRFNHMPNQLSGGEKQRVAIARALINNPLLLLADEPTGNLDSKNGEEIFNLLRNLNIDRKITIMMVTHDNEKANKTDRIIYIKDGEILNNLGRKYEIN